MINGIERKTKQRSMKSNPPPHVLVIDNYDSFTYNLVLMLRELGSNVTVKRNDKFDLNEVAEYDKIVLSPGPGIPEEAGQLLELIDRYKTTKSILGVCLGHQAIAATFGAELINLSKVVHGQATQLEVVDLEEEMFSRLPSKINVGRYHSWIVGSKLPDCLKVTATANGQIMALRHKEYDLKGVQFHPESILTEYGKEMMENWVFGEGVKSEREKEREKEPTP
jgi:anthranilate synthase component 2